MPKQPHNTAAILLYDRNSQHRRWTHRNVGVNVKLWRSHTNLLHVEGWKSALKPTLYNMYLKSGAGWSFQNKNICILLSLNETGNICWNICPATSSIYWQNIIRFIFFKGGEKRLKHWVKQVILKREWQQVWWKIMEINHNNHLYIGYM